MAPVALVFVLTAASVSSAQPRAQNPLESSPTASELASARAQFVNAQKLFQVGKFADALPLFLDVAETTRSPNARLYVGHCFEQLGRMADAYKAFELVVKQTSANRDDKYEPAHEAALAELALLNVRVGKLVISLTDIPPGVAVTLDGTPIDEKDMGSSIVVPPGDHHIEATANGVSPAHRDVNVDGGEMKTVILSLTKLEEARAVIAPAPAKTRSNESRSAGGVGLLGVGLFTVAGLSAKSTFDKLQRECPAGCTDVGHLDDIDRGRILQTGANAGLVIGVLALGTGVTLVILGGEKRGDGTSVSFANGGGTVRYTGHF